MRFCAKHLARFARQIAKLQADYGEVYRIGTQVSPANV